MTTIIFEAESCKNFKAVFLKLCFSKVQFQMHLSLRVLHVGGSERSQSIQNFIKYWDLIITQYLKSKTFLDGCAHILIHINFSPSLLRIFRRYSKRASVRERYNRCILGRKGKEQAERKGECL